MTQNKFKIVNYHYVRSIKNSDYPKIKALETEKFINQIKYFQKNGKIITIENIVDCLTDDLPLPENSFLLTFDDGIKDIYSNVYPILKKNNIQGIFFPIAKTIEHQVMADVHKIHVLLASVNNTSLIIEQIKSFIHLNKKQFNLKSTQEYLQELRPHRYDSQEINFIKQILQYKLPLKLRKMLIDNLFKKFIKISESELSEKFYVSEQEISEMIEGGMIFGNHSYSHPWLTQISLSDAKKEIHLSEIFLNRFRKNNIKCISYPYGDFNEDILKICNDENIEFGFGINIDDATINHTNSLMLSRYDTNDFPQ